MEATHTTRLYSLEQSAGLSQAIGVGIWWEIIIRLRQWRYCTPRRYRGSFVTARWLRIAWADVADHFPYGMAY